MLYLIIREFIHKNYLIPVLPDNNEIKTEKSWGNTNSMISLMFEEIKTLVASIN